MLLGDARERFLQQAPIPVMFRALLEHALDPDELDRMFEQAATRQSTRELLSSSLVNLMSALVCRAHPSVRSAALAALAALTATLSAVSERLKGLEPGVGRGLVLHTTGRREPSIHHLDAPLPELVPGSRATTLDGNPRAGPSIASRRLGPRERPRSRGRRRGSSTPAPCWSSMSCHARMPPPKGGP